MAFYGFMHCAELLVESPRAFHPERNLLSQDVAIDSLSNSSKVLVFPRK